jgi:hypothetical protein
MDNGGTGIVDRRANDSSLQTVGSGSIWAGPGFFETLQIPILYGRALDARDREGALAARRQREHGAPLLRHRQRRRTPLPH